MTQAMTQAARNIYYLPKGVRCYVVAIIVDGEKRYSRGHGPYDAESIFTWTTNPRLAFEFKQGCDFSKYGGRIESALEFARSHAKRFARGAKVYRRGPRPPHDRDRER